MCKQGKKGRKGPKGKTLSGKDDSVNNDNVGTEDHDENSNEAKPLIKKARVNAHMRHLQWTLISVVYVSFTIKMMLQRLVVKLDCLQLWMLAALGLFTD